MHHAVLLAAIMCGPVYEQTVEYTWHPATNATTMRIEGPGPFGAWMSQQGTLTMSIEPDGTVRWSGTIRVRVERRRRVLFPRLFGRWRR